MVTLETGLGLLSLKHSLFSIYKLQLEFHNKYLVIQVRECGDLTFNVFQLG